MVVYAIQALTHVKMSSSANKTEKLLCFIGSAVDEVALGVVGVHVFLAGLALKSPFVESGSFELVPLLPNWYVAARSISEF